MAGWSRAAWHRSRVKSKRARKCSCQVARMQPPESHVVISTWNHGLAANAQALLVAPPTPPAMNAKPRALSQRF
jgi:hypothetical protein